VTLNLAETLVAKSRLTVPYGANLFLKLLRFSGLLTCLLTWRCLGWSLKVVPLSQRSGILEWCEGTVPMGEYLIGGVNAAHHRYRPDDWKPVDCRRVMSVRHGSFQFSFQVCLSCVCDL